jgi:hypothetical protein
MTEPFERRPALEQASVNTLYFRGWRQAPRPKTEGKWKVGGTTKEEIMRFSLPLERRKAPLPIVIIGTPSLKRKKPRSILIWRTPLSPGARENRNSQNQALWEDVQQEPC